MNTSLYSLLGVADDADTVAIALAYARRLHDSEPDGTRATLTYAYLVLSDPRRRAAYDTALRHSTTEPSTNARPAPPTEEC